MAGIGALIWLRRFALAAMLPITLAIAIGASAARKYPFGDIRTSTFWLVAVPVLLARPVAPPGRPAAPVAPRGAPGGGAVGPAALVAGPGPAPTSPSLSNTEV